MKNTLLVILLISVLGLSAQESLSDRIYYGGGFGFSSSSNQTNLMLMPNVGYKITENFSAGVGVIYQYVRVRNPDLSINNYGGSVFTRYNLFQQFFAYSEFERLNFEYPTSDNSTARAGYNSLLIGGGYSEMLGGNSSFSLMALYNVLYDETEFPRPYSSPWVIRAGIGVGIF